MSFGAPLFCSHTFLSVLSFAFAHRVPRMITTCRCDAEVGSCGVGFPACVWFEGYCVGAKPSDDSPRSGHDLQPEFPRVLPESERALSFQTSRGSSTRDPQRLRL